MFKSPGLRWFLELDRTSLTCRRISTPYRSPASASLLGTFSLSPPSSRYMGEGASFIEHRRRHFVFHIHVSGEFSFISEKFPGMHPESLLYLL